MKRYDLADLRGKRTLLVASTGGHLNQLVRLEKRLGVHPESRWVTFDTPQSRSLLAGRRVDYVPYVKPRDWKNILRAAVLAAPLVGPAEAVVSTGAGLALAVLPHALLRGKPTVYIESISRVLGPSTSGRLLARLPRIGVFAQHRGWIRPPWRPGPSVLSAYRATPGGPRAPKRLLVTLGTIAPYRFDRIVDVVLAYVTRHPDVEVVWQLGCTTRDDLPGRVVDQLSAAAFGEAIQWADAVVAHSGVGVAMNILDAGKAPLLLARRRDEGEHVDDHQEQIRAYLVDRGLAFDAAEAFADDDALAAAVGTVITAGEVDE